MVIARSSKVRKNYFTSKKKKTHRIYKRNFAYFFYAKHPNPKGKSPSSSSFTHSTDCMLLCISSYDVGSHDEPAQAGREVR